jgi:hypothetical protein
METAVIATYEKWTDIYEVVLSQYPLIPRVGTKSGYQTMTPTVLADFPRKVNMRGSSCWLRGLARQAFRVCFHTAPLCPCFRFASARQALSLSSSSIAFRFGDFGPCQTLDGVADLTEQMPFDPADDSSGNRVNVQHKTVSRP